MLEKSNHNHNKKVGEPRSLINGQAVHCCGKMRFGLRTFSAVGSAVIAVYNLMLLLNRQPVLADIARELYIRARTPLGLFGVRSLRIFRYFSAHYIPVNIDRDFSSFCEKFRPGFCGIIVCKSSKGVFSLPHAMALENDNGRIFVYNRIANSTKRYEFSSTEFSANSKKFIIGYYIDANEFGR